MRTFHWGDIDRGFKGFEDLAFEYVKSEFPTGSTWEHSAYTRDGNRDGYSIIFGFRPHDLSQEEWWMEAKYSTEKKILSRYRLDSTIVSAAINGNVSKVIFVTNISISTKTIVDIRTALKQAVQCNEVHFCTKNTLEHWLTKNPDIFKRFFPKNDISTLTIKPLFLAEEIDFFPEQKIGLSFIEPLKYLQLDQEYYLYFSIYSDHARTLPLTIGEEFSGVSLCTPTKITLSSGITPCVVKIRLEKNYNIRYELPDGEIRYKSNWLDGALLKAGTLEIIAKNPLEVMESPERLFLPSQEDNLEKLRESYDFFKIHKLPSIISLTGVSGVGKTYVVDRFVKENITLEQSIFRITFSSHPITNDLNIFYFLIFCLYPYLPPDMVDETYLSELHNPSLESSVMFQASKYLRQPDRLHPFFISKINEDIFPNNLHLNPRGILLDDVQKLDEDSFCFLFAAINELVKKNQPVFVLISGWPEITYSHAYRSMAEKFYIYNMNLSLTSKDLVSAIVEKGIVDFKPNYHLLPVIFPNIIDFLSYLKYRKGEILHNVEDLLVDCRFFLNTNVAQESILSRFQKLFEIDLQAKDLCIRIYWSINGIKLSSPMSQVEYKLVQYELVKPNDDNTRLIPYHDLYRKIFCQRFEMPPCRTIKTKDDIYTDTVRILSLGGTEIELAQAISLLKEWKAEGRFYAILYVLEGLFETEKRDNLCNRIGKEKYYQLFLLYAFGVTNGSRYKSGNRVFKKIVEETELETNSEILLVRMEAIFELINSSFEWLMHNKAREYIQIIDKLICSLQMLGKLPKDNNLCEKYILSRQVEMLISSEQEIPQAENLFATLDCITKTYHYDYEREFFKLRYAESLFFRDTSRAIDMVQECRNNLLALRGPEEKFYLWAKMDFEFLQFVLNQEPHIDEMENAHNGLRKDFFNDYRKRLIAMANVYYVCGLTSQGDRLLFSDVATLRELRPRQKGFYAQTMALHYALSEEYNCATEELRKASNLFADFPSYLSIINHNLRVIENGFFDSKMIKFCYNNTCEKNIYCIDPRCIW